MFYHYTYFVNGVPEYVGKGVERRALAHLVAGNQTYWARHVKKAVKEGCDVQIKMAYVENEQAALDEETRLIALYGRRNIGTGTLFNLTDGGEGVSGMRMSEESKAKMRAKKLGVPRSEESRRAQSIGQTGRKGHTSNLGKKYTPWSAEDRAAQSARGKGRVQSEETKAKRESSLAIRRMDPAYKQKLSESTKAAWAKRKSEATA
jgi:hypothetical protein